VARGPADEEDAGRGRRILVPALRVEHGAAGLQPLDGQLEAGIGEAGAGRAGARTLAILVVAVPRDVDDALDLAAHRVEGRIVEPLPDAPRELLARELDVALARPHPRRAPLPIRHRPLPVRAIPGSVPWPA
jgi:hypothetical protein